MGFGVRHTLLLSPWGGNSDASELVSVERAEQKHNLLG